MKKDTPFYPHNYRYAKAHDETRQYWAAHQRNVECRDAIEDAISIGATRSLIKSVIEEYGADRVRFVLSNSLCSKDNPKTYTLKNKDWAYNHVDWRNDCVVEKSVEAIDTFASISRQIMKGNRDRVESEQGKPSVKLKIARKNGGSKVVSKTRNGKKNHSER